MTFIDDCARLLVHVRDAEGDPERVEKAAKVVMSEVAAFPAYVSSVARMETESALRKAILDDGDRASWQQTMEEADRARVSAHDGVQHACSIINRICDAYGVGHICPDMPADETSRRSARWRDVSANFAAAVTLEAYVNRDDSMHMAELDDPTRQALADAVDALKGMPGGHLGQGVIKERIGSRLADFEDGDDDGIQGTASEGRGVDGD